MAVFIKSSGAIILSFLSLFLSGNELNAQPTLGYAGLNDVFPNQVLISEALEAVGHRCSTSDCIALRTILETDNVFSIARATPMRIAAIGAAGRAYVARLTKSTAINLQIRHVLLNHPERFPAVCARLRNLATHYGENVSRPPDIEFMSHAILMAELIDSRTHGDCLPSMLASLPHIAAVDQWLIVGTRDDCERSQWRNPGCRRIARPAPATAARP